MVFFRGTLLPDSVSISNSSDKEDFSYKDVVPPLSNKFTLESFLIKHIRCWVTRQ